MTQTDAYGWTADFPTWRGEVVTRVQDFLSRKKGVAADRWKGLLRRLEEAVSFSQVSATLRQVLRRVRREQLETGAEVDVEFEALCQRVIESGRKTTIENYSAYLFTVDLRL